MTDQRANKATFYVQLEPVFGFGTDPATGERYIRGAKAVAITQSRPTRPKAGTIAVRLEVLVPQSLFLPLRPAAVIALPEDLGVLSTPVEVTAVSDLDP